jgi:HK97 family phage portal protein
MNLGERIRASIKAATITFQRGYQWAINYILPRTRIDYAAEVGQGLLSSVVIAVVGWQARNFSSAPIRVRKIMADGGREDVLPADFGPGLMLKLLRKPNAFYDGIQFSKALIVDYATTANAYVFKNRGGGAGRISDLWWIPSMLIRPKWDEDRPEIFISHYEYRPGNGLIYKLRVEDIIHFRDGMDPQNIRVGLNKLASLVREVYTDDEAAAYSATVLSNLGVPGVVIAPELTPHGGRQALIADPDAIKAQFTDRFSGDNRGKPLVMTAPTKVQVLSFSPKDLTLKDLRRLPEERMSAVFGVAAIVAGLGAGLDRSTFANFGEARAASYEENILPTQDAFAEVWWARLLSELADEWQYEVDYDLTKVRVLQEDQTAVWERNLKAMLGGAFMRSKFLENIGEKPAPDGTDDVWIMESKYVVTPKAAMDLENAQAVEDAKNPEPEVVEETVPVEPVPPAEGGNGRRRRVALEGVSG